MYTLTPKKVAQITGGKCVGSSNGFDTPIIGAVRDNRDVKPGNLFVCIKGERTDGHLYANDAFNAGAVCCLTEQELQGANGAYVIVDSTTDAIKTLGEYHRSMFDIPVIGITGSVGKTTAKELVAAVLEAKLCVLKTEKNLNNELGVPLTLMSINEKHEAAVIEMGISGFGEMSRLAKMVRPDIFLMTKIGYAHIEELGDLQGVLRAKTEAFAYMKSDGVAVMNGDDELLRTYDSKIKTITFGIEASNDYRAANVKTLGTSSISFDIVSSKGQFPVEIPAYGSHIAALAPAAAAVGSLLGLTQREIQKGFLSYAPVEGRSNISDVNGITLINDCYNANPNSVKAALISMSQLPCRHIAILGDMLELGKNTKDMHLDVGAFAAENGVDVLLCHGNEATHIYEGYKLAEKGEAEHYCDIEDLMGDIPNKIKKGDAVLVKASRGMRFERLLPVISAQEQHKKTV
ncbi:MAG: UDP-N-acetylmuramoyl-tripeptide--D-alanyl-D-alanine ligase [Oscillospiraceae bacterium]|nr:UDP-N-acetylmuramoyl-tripeptide--D-alanyl-D-alanine ligase [Oscillospiraceae bacterium]